MVRSRYGVTRFLVQLVLAPVARRIAVLVPCTARRTHGRLTSFRDTPCVRIVSSSKFPTEPRIEQPPKKIKDVTRQGQANRGGKPASIAARAIGDGRNARKGALKQAHPFILCHFVVPAAAHKGGARTGKESLSAQGLVALLKKFLQVWPCQACLALPCRAAIRKCKKGHTTRERVMVSEELNVRSTEYLTEYGV
jgi:hypothetical protein